MADFLRDELLRGRWAGAMPGRARLAKELGIGGDLTEAALSLLEREGWLTSQGPRRRRLITRKSADMAKSGIRVGILYYEENDRKTDYLFELVRRLGKQGCRVTPAPRTLIDLGMDAKKVAHHVSKIPVDAWLVVAGSREILEWFSQQPVPAFAIHGRQGAVPIAATGSRKSAALVTAVRRLAELGHRRIVFLVREERRKPEPGIVERIFLDELRAQGIPVGPYNLPDWENSPEGFHLCLSSLFGVTPPTAIIADGVELFTATQQFLLHEGIRVPQDVSMVCGDPHPNFAWCQPGISHISYDSSIWVRDALRWVKKAALGKDDRRQIISDAEFVEGGTVGPALGN